MVDFYFGFLLLKDAKVYGIKSTEAFTAILTSKAKEDWIANFSSDDWSYSKEGKGKGLTVEGLKVAEILSFLSKNAEIKT